MDIFEIQAKILIWIQSVASPVLDTVASVITYMGSQYVVVMVLLYIVWCVDKEKGIWICWSSCFSTALSNSIKGIFKVKRPIGYDGVRTLASETATSYSFPSGHAQNSASLMTGLHIISGDRIPLWLTLIVPAAVGISRLYLGCHWPLDVLAGYVLGITVPQILWRIYERFPEKRDRIKILSTVVLMPFLLLKGDVADFWKSFGLLAGFVIGSFLEKKYINYSVAETAGRKIIRISAGMGIIIVIYLIMKLTFPDTYAFSAIRYGIISFTGIFICPYIFVRCGI